MSFTVYFGRSRAKWVSGLHGLVWQAGLSRGVVWQAGWSRGLVSVAAAAAGEVRRPGRQVAAGLGADIDGVLSGL